MIETFIALLLAHAVADYVLQTRWSIAHKAHPLVLLAHGVIVGVTAGVALGRWDSWEIWALAGAHLVIDAVKTFGKFEGIGAHLLDQLAHLATLAVVAVVAPTLFAQGLWASAGPAVPHVMALVAGAILVTRAGGFAVGTLMRPYADDDLPKGLENGGVLIGILERGLIYLLVLVGQPAGIGFLIAAKSILRFDTASKDQKTGEYVIIGTLASFGWALLVSYAIVTLRTGLAPLAIGPATP